MGFRRRLARGLAGGAEAAGNVAQMLFQDQLLRRRSLDASNQAMTNKLIEDALTQQDKLADPKLVAELGPERMQAMQEAIFQRIPPELRSRIPRISNFAGMDAPESQRMAPVRKSIADAQTPEALPSDFALESGLTAARVPARRSLPVPGEASTVDVPTDPLVQLSEETKRRRDALMAAEPRDAVEDFSSGVKTTKFVTNREKAGLQVQGERTAGQEAARQGAVAGSQEQARQTVLNTPENVRGFASREAASTYARQMASNQADKAMGAGSFKPELKVIEDQDSQGNKVYRVMQVTPGTQVGTNVSAENLTADMRKSWNFANRATAAHNQLLELEPKLKARGIAINLLDANNWRAIQDPLTKQAARAMNEYVNAMARDESGAAIGETEWNRYMGNAGYANGDDDATLADKQNARRRSIEGMAQEAGTRLGSQFVSLAEIQRIAEEDKRDPKDVQAEFERSGMKVVR